ncbi:MAG: translation initiation factor IF-2 [Bryobacteraceae bacterium]|nr:translation initiation factor IF-2 [Bryobacteraceae bacterium]
MKKIRINELARECEQPNSVILALLPQFGITEKKTHSSSIDEEVAEKIRRHFGIVVGGEKAEPAPEPEATVTEPAAPPVAPEMQPAAVEQTEPEPVAAPARPPEAPPVVVTPPRTPDLAAIVARPARPVRPPLAGRAAVQAGLETAPAAVVAPPPTSQPAAPTESVPPAAEVSGPPVAPSAPPSTQVPPPASAQVALAPAPGPAAEKAEPPQSKPVAPPPKPGQILGVPRPSVLPTLRLVQSPPKPPVKPGAQPVPAASATPATPPAAVVVGKQPASLAGQPAPRPVVPPHPELAKKLAETRAMPGQPVPRPGQPIRPVPGQPIYQGPVRPGQPLRPSATGGAVARTRGPHPTTPVPVTAPPADGRRAVARKPPRAVEREREPEEKEKILHRPAPRREELPERPAEGKKITIAEGITVKELAEKLELKAAIVIKKLMDRRILATINQTLDVKLAEEIARELGAEVSQVSFEEEAATQIELEQAGEDQVLEPRAPVVTVMGHVDHGKTTLLDAIRQTNVAAREAGGITQHIGAYEVFVELEEEREGKRQKVKRKIVFIDTPGHEAFTRMRARGAKVTDVVVLVVAADDGVMPQTLEAIDHARAAGVPIVVAINKIDKPDAQPDRVKHQLSERGLVPDDWGGDTPMVPVSARTKQNLDHLLEMILLVADLRELKANPKRPAVGTVLEARMDKGRGPVATVLVNNGTLRVGDYVLSGTVLGKVRGMFNDRGERVEEAGPATPVEVIGLEALPEVGDSIQVVTDPAKAKQIVLYREQKAREQALLRVPRISLEKLHTQLKEGEVKELKLIVKADVAGTAEVLRDTLEKLSSEKVRIQVIHAGVGAITENDVTLASASDAVIIGFNVRPDRNAAALIEQEKVDVRLHSVIYELTDEIKRAMAGLLEPVVREVYRGRAEVKQIFRIAKVGTVAGCLVVDGVITRDSEVRVLRDNVVVYTGRIASLKRYKDDASEVKSGLECGLAIENFNDIKPGDVLEAFVREQAPAEVLV